MSFFVYRKSTGNFKLVQKDRGTILKELGEAGKNLSDYLVLPPEEFKSFLNENQNREISNARLNQIKEDNPQLSQYFPRTAREIAERGEKPFATRAGSDDVLSLGGRSLGAIADGVLNKGDFVENYMKSLGQAEAEEQERGLIGRFAQDVLRDPLLLPGMAIPVNKIPVVKNIGAKATSDVGKFAKGSLLKPAVEGAVGGAIVEAARPVVTSEEFSPKKVAEGILTGAVLNTGLHNAGGALKYGAAKARNKYKGSQTASEHNNIIVENSRQRHGRSADEITDIDISNARELAEKLEKKGLTLEDVIMMEPRNPVPSDKSKSLDFWDGKAAEMDFRNYANSFDNMPLYRIRDDLAARAKVNPKALEATLNPESMALMSKLHSEGRLGVGRRHLNDIHNSQFKPEGKPDAKDLYMEQHSGDLVNPEAVKELGDIMRSFEKNHTTGGTLSKHHKPARDIVDEYAEKLLNTDGTPKDITLGEWNQIRNELGARKADFEGQVNLTGISKEGKHFLDNLYKAFKKQEFEMLNPDAQSAHNSRAEFKRTHDDIIDNISKNNIDVAAENYADRVANATNDAIAKKDAILQRLEASDRLRGTSHTKEARHLGWEQNLTGNSPKETPFYLPDRNMHMTGKYNAPDGLTVREASDLLNHAVNKKLDGFAAFSEQPKPSSGKGYFAAFSEQPRLSSDKGYFSAFPEPKPSSPKPSSPKPSGGNNYFDVNKAMLGGYLGSSAFNDENKEMAVDEETISMLAQEARKLGISKDSDIERFIRTKLTGEGHPTIDPKVPVMTSGL